MYVRQDEDNSFHKVCGEKTAHFYYNLGFNIVPFHRKMPKQVWKTWQSTRQKWDDVSTWWWNNGIGAINGINDWHSIDIDSASSFQIVAQVLQELGLPATYEWVVRSGSNTGYHIWFKCRGTPKLRRETKSVYIGVPKEPGTPSFKQIELRWQDCCTILPPTLHEKGLRYEWVRGVPKEDPVFLTTTQVEHLMHALTRLIEEKEQENNERKGKNVERPVPLASRWAERALQLELTNLHQTTLGTRNSQLNKSAFSLGQIVAGNYLTENDVISSLTAIALDIGLDERETERTIHSGLSEGMRHPRHPKMTERQPEVREKKAEVKHLTQKKRVLSKEELADFSADDAGNADAFYALHEQEYLYCSAYGWMYYTGTHWKEIENEIDKTIVDVLRKRRHAAVDLEREAVVNCTKADMKRISGCREVLKSLVIEKVDTFDNHPDFLNCKSGVVDLRTGQITPHHPSQRFTYCIDIPYQPSTDTTSWENYLTSVIGGGKEAISYLQKAIGYSLTGHTSEECMFYLHGPTRGGKGTVAEALLSLLPRPFATMVDFNSFTAKREGDTNNFDLAPLKPSRIIIASESNKYQSLNPAKVKQLTGGDLVTCSFKHKNMFTYRPQFKVWLLSNHKVNADPDDDAVWGRVRVIEFPQSFLGKEDRTLKPRMKSKENLQAILAWAIEGAMQWYQLEHIGLVAPVSIQQATASHRAELDIVQQWIDECCELDLDDQNTWTTSKALNASYVAWCHENNTTEPKREKGLAMALRQKGCQPDDVRRIGEKSARGIQGIRLVT